MFAEESLFELPAFDGGGGGGTGAPAGGEGGEAGGGWTGFATPVVCCDGAELDVVVTINEAVDDCRVGDGVIAVVVDVGAGVVERMAVMLLSTQAL